MRPELLRLWHYSGTYRVLNVIRGPPEDLSRRANVNDQIFHPVGERRDDAISKLSDDVESVALWRIFVTLNEAAI